jgi:lysophospholipase L1-like esterase
MQRRLQDFPQLARYREATASWLSARGESRVVFLGDSITDGWRARRILSGQAVCQSRHRRADYAADAHPLPADVIALQPRAVLILAGTNDIAGNTGPATLEMIEDNLTSIAELAKAHNIRVILASVLPIHDQGKTKMSERRPPETIRALNVWIKKYAAEKARLPGLLQPSD